MPPIDALELRDHPFVKGFQMPSSQSQSQSQTETDRDRVRKTRLPTTAFQLLFCKLSRLN